MFSNMPRITFFLRSNNNKANTHSLYCRLVLNGIASEFSTNEEISPNQWDQETQIFIGNTEEKTDYINLLTESIRYKLKTLVLLQKKENESLNPKKIIEIYKNPCKIEVVEHDVVIFDVIQKFIDHEYKEGEIKPITIAIHERFLRHLKEFLQVKKCYVSEFNEVKAEQFKEWFRSPRKTKKGKLIPATKNKTSASRHISFFRDALQWGVKNGIIKTHNLLYYEGERDKRKEIEPMTEDELFNLIQHNFVSQMLNNIKDLFLFQTATGISYGDIWSNFEIQDTESGKIIIGKRNKGDGNAFFVPYDELAEIILMKYNYKLPYYENGVYNRLLKEIAQLVGIKTYLKTHIARKTFATMKLSNGWTLGAVSVMLGHSSEKTTEQYYAKKTAKIIITEMNNRNQHNSIMN